MLTIVIRCVALLVIVVGRGAVVVIVGSSILTCEDWADVDALKYEINYCFRCSTVIVLAYPNPNRWCRNS